MKQARAIPNNMDDYIMGFPENIRQILETLRATIRKAAPDAEEIINYAIPTFYLHGNLVHFAAYTKHIGFYPGASGVEAFKEELSLYKTSKGAIQFPVGKRLPLSLISKIIKYRVKQNKEIADIKARSKKAKTK